MSDLLASKSGLGLSRDSIGAYVRRWLDAWAKRSAAAFRKAMGPISDTREQMIVVPVRQVRRIRWLWAVMVLLIAFALAAVGFFLERATRGMRGLEATQVLAALPQAATKEAMAPVSSSTANRIKELEQERNALRDDLDDLANLIPGTGSETGVAIRRVRVVRTEKAADGSVVLRLRMTLVRNRPKASQIVVRVALTAGGTEAGSVANVAGDAKGKEASIRYAAVFEDTIRFAEGKIPSNFRVVVRQGDSIVGSTEVSKDAAMAWLISTGQAG
jgi:hypothetical protein